jgi:hypothetical protein
LTETALAFGIGSIAWSAGARCGHDLIDERNAMHIARQRLNDLGDECWRLQEADLEFLRLWSAAADVELAAASLDGERSAISHNA